VLQRSIRHHDVTMQYHATPQPALCRDTVPHGTILRHRIAHDVAALRHRAMP